MICPVCGMTNCSLGTGSLPCVEGLARHALLVAQAALVLDPEFTQSDMARVLAAIDRCDAQEIADVCDWLQRVEVVYASSGKAGAA